MEASGKNGKALVFLCSSMLIFGTIGIFRKYIPLESDVLAMYRGFIGTAGLLLLLALRRQRLSWEILRRRGFWLVVSGAAIGLNWILLFEAYRYTTVAVATLCYYMAPIFVLLLAPLLLKESLTPRKIFCTALAFCGMILVSGVLSGGLHADFRGILFGLGAALFYAFIILCNKKLSDVPAFEKTVVQLAAAGLCLLPYSLLNGHLAASKYDGKTLLLLLLVGLIHTGLAYALYFASIGTLPAQTAALFSYIDPAAAILLSALFLKEPFGFTELAGTVLVLGAAVFSELKA